MRLLAGLGLAALGALLGAAAVQVGGGARGGEDVRTYLLAHPEVIPEAMTRLQERETAKVIAANRAALVTPVGSAWAGNPKGDVTVVEFLDYNCGYCRASLPVVAKLLAADSGVKIIYREWPILAESSRVAARAGLLAASHGSYARFHDALYAAGPLTDASIAAAARAAGVDASRATAAADPVIDANLSLAHQLGMSGTPSWVIGDRVLAGAQPLEQLQAAVAAARGK